MPSRRVWPVVFFSCVLFWGHAVQAEMEGCPVFPPDNIWNVRVDTLPVHPDSEAFIATIGADEPLHPDFGSGVWPPGSDSPVGIPITVVSGTQPLVPVTFYYAEESDPGPYPIPPDALVEGGPGSSGDRHVLVFDRDNCMLYELFDAWPHTEGSWEAGSGAIFDLTSHALRPEGWTSADAAGLPILPGLVRFEEVASGEIRHALRFTAPETRRAYVWPARHFASSLTGEQYPPMGQRFRLKADIDVSGFSAPVQVILNALKRYGMILADNGAPWYVSGVPDERWDNDILHELHQIRGSDFEAVDASGLMIHPDSGQARVEGPMIIDHTCTDISMIPEEWLELAKLLTIHYAHTSHGSQLVSGAENLESLDSRYSFACRTSRIPGLPPEEDPPALRMYDGNPPETYITPEDYWSRPLGRIRTRLVARSGKYGFSMWAWCGQVSDADSSYIQAYLDAMDRFEGRFPEMRFIYMTGHLDGSGEQGNLHQRNEQIRAYCKANNKILFDFADIERYDPDGNDFLNRGADDGCNYEGGNWADEWCAAHPGSELCAWCDCAHSRPLNCNLKARAFWWMMARLAGWPGPSQIVFIQKPPLP